MPIALLIWVVEMVYFALHLGVKEGADTYLYLRFAQFGTFGDAYVDAHYQWYRSYTLFLSFFLKSGFGLTWAIVVQVVLASTSLWALYDIAKRIGSEKAASWALLLYVLWTDSHVWHFYLYSDSLFVSCSVWCLWAFCNWREWKPLCYLFPLVLLTAFIRPPGIILFTLYLVLLVMSLPINKWLKLAIGCFALMGCLWCVERMLPTFEIIETYKKGEVIYGYPAWNVTPSTPVHFESSGNSLVALLQFICYNPLFFLQLLLNKTVAFLAHAKPYYSWPHNLYIVVLLFPSYSLFVSGWKHWKEEKGKWTVLAWCLGQTLLVSFTIEDWDGRFLLPIAPFVFIGAAVGIQKSLENMGSCVQSALH